MDWTQFDGAIKDALIEDGARKDATTEALIPQGIECRGELVVKEDGIICGLFLARRICKLFDEELEITVKHEDGEYVGRGTCVATCEGPAASILEIERVVLNYVQRLSGIATLTHKYVQEISGTETNILDTRKTTPGLRQLEKYAVKCGGGINHRMGLSDMVLIKENHLRLRALCEGKTSIERAIQIARTTNPDLAVEVEVESIEELQNALNGAPDFILLDNMPPHRVQEAVRIVDALEKNGGRRVQLEASGNIQLNNVSQYAETGVDRISIGSLTHSARALDVSMLISE